MAHVIRTSFERRVFTTPDGRILGNTVRKDTWFLPFTDGQTDETEHNVETAGPFRTMREAGDWVGELRRAEDVVRCQLRGGTRMVFAT